MRGRLGTVPRRRACSSTERGDSTSVSLEASRVCAVHSLNCVLGFAVLGEKAVEVVDELMDVPALRRDADHSGECLCWRRRWQLEHESANGRDDDADESLNQGRKFRIWNRQVTPELLQFVADGL